MRRLIMAALSLLSTPAVAQGSFSGLYPGMTQIEANRILMGFGKVTTATLPDGTTVMVTQNMNVSLCHATGLVFAVTHDLDPSFSAFARTAQLAEARRGKGVFRIWGNENNPPTYGIQEEWLEANGVKYDVGFNTYDNRNSANEGLYKKCS